MPNWCAANVELTATEKEIKRLKKAIKDGNKGGAQKGLLNALVPQPEFTDGQEWYGWNTANWGTKWELAQVEITDESKTSLSLNFDTAWGPAIQAFETWADGGEGEFTYTYKYFEPGMGFLGEATHDGTCGFDDYVDGSTDNERYRELAESEWGEDFSWEDEQEEEEDDLVAQAPYHPGYEDVAVTDDGMDDSEELDEEAVDLEQALAELKAEFEALMATEQDPEYVYLKEDLDTLSRRIADYAARQEADTFKDKE